MSLVEFETYWSIDDAMDAHEALDIAEALEKEARDAAEAKAKLPK